jgi:(p)ppGpp synthase/HD superfamily hydrolase
MQKIELLHTAVRVATQAHAGQTRKGDAQLPYITHPTAVALLVQQYTADTDVACAALLHDVIEDTPYSFDDMRRDFGERISNFVFYVTEVEHAHRAETTWHERKENYLNKLREAPQESLLISAADRIHNMHSLLEMHAEHGPEIWESFGSVSMDERLAFYESAAEILNQRLESDILTVHNDYLARCKSLIV